MNFSEDSLMNFDEILDNCIEAIEQGQSIETCLALYPAHAPELEPLLSLVGSLRSVSMPEMSLAAFDSGRMAVAEAAKQKELTRSASEMESDYVSHNGSVDADVRQSMIHSRSSLPLRADIPKKRFIFAVPAVIRPLAGVAVAVVLAIVTGSLLFMLQGQISDLTGTLSSGGSSSDGIGTIEKAEISEIPNNRDLSSSSGQSTVPLATVSSDSVIVESADEVPTATPLSTNIPLPTSTPLPPTSTAVVIVPAQVESSAAPSLQDDSTEQREMVNSAIVNESVDDTTEIVDVPASSAGADGSIAAPASPTSVPPTSVPPTSVPPTSVPPTSVPPTAVPPTAVPPASESSMDNVRRQESGDQQSNNGSNSNQEEGNPEPTAVPPVEVLPAPTAIVQSEVQPETAPTAEAGDSTIMPVVVVVESVIPTDTVTIETVSVLSETEEVATTSEPPAEPVDSSVTMTTTVETTTVEKPSAAIVAESKAVTVTTSVYDGNDAEPVPGSTDVEETPIIQKSTELTASESVEIVPELEIQPTVSAPVATTEPSTTDESSVVLDETPEPIDGTGGENEEPVDPSDDEPDPGSAEGGTSGEEQPTARSMTLPAPTEEAPSVEPTVEPAPEVPTAEAVSEAPTAEPVSEEPTDEPSGDDESGDDESGDDESGDDESGDDESGSDESGSDESGEQQNEDTRRILAPAPEEPTEEPDVGPSAEVDAPVEEESVEINVDAPLEKPKFDQPDIPDSVDESSTTDKDNNRINEPSIELAEPTSSTK